MTADWPDERFCLGIAIFVYFSKKCLFCKTNQKVWGVVRNFYKQGPVIHCPSWPVRGGSWPVRGGSWPVRGGSWPVRGGSWRFVAVCGVCMAGSWRFVAGSWRFVALRMSLFFQGFWKFFQIGVFSQLLPVSANFYPYLQQQGTSSDESGEDTERGKSEARNHRNVKTCYNFWSWACSATIPNGVAKTLLATLGLSARATRVNQDSPI